MDLNLKETSHPIDGRKAMQIISKELEFDITAYMTKLWHI